MVSASSHITAGWLFAAVPEGIVCVGRGVTVEAELPSAAAEAVVAAARTRPLEQALAAAGVATEDATRLLDRLAACGAVLPDPPAVDAVDAVPLIDAIAIANDGGELPPRLVTAEEALIVPPGISGRTARRLLRSFIAGMRSHDRLRAYGYAALTRRPTVCRDLPHPSLADTVAGSAVDPHRVRVVELADGHVASVAIGELDGLGAGQVHRLGTAVAVRFAGAPPPGAPPVHICMARVAHPNLRFPGKGHGEATGIAEAPAHAELIARAEAAERFACGDLTGRRLVRASPEDLDAPAIRPADVIRHSERQVADGRALGNHDLTDRLWTAAATASGDARWVPAEMAFSPFADPGVPARLPGSTSSGCAAHSTFAEARRHAIAELVERDAFMWHWVQRVARERIDPASLPAATRHQIEEMRGAGRAVDLVNLTLDLKPVVLCAIRTDELLSIAASCRERAADAAGRALHEAATLLWSPPAAVPLVEDPTTVELPLDHLGVYRAPSARDHAAFLWGGDEVIAADEVVGVEGPIDAAVLAVGEPVVVDLTCPGSQPFAVARAFVPGLVPLTFGYDREPLGMERLRSGISLSDGSRLDATLDPGSLGPLLPHPFP